MIQLTVLDYIFIIIIAAFAIVAMIKGFITEIFSKASWILGILGGVLFYDDLAVYFEPKISSAALRNVLSFILIFIVVFLVLKIVGAIISKIFELNILKSLDKALGLFFGLIEGCAIVGLIIFLLSIQPFFDATPLLSQSFIFDIYQKVISSPDFKEVTTHV